MPVAALWRDRDYRPKETKMRIPPDFPVGPLIVLVAAAFWVPLVPDAEGQTSAAAERAALEARQSGPGRIGRIDGPGPFAGLDDVGVITPPRLGGEQRFTVQGTARAERLPPAGSNLPRFPPADAADLDGIFRWRFVGEHGFDLTASSMAFSNDADCDGSPELLIGARRWNRPRSDRYNIPGAAYLVSMADVAAADAVDGTADGVVDLGLVAAQPRSWKLTGHGHQYVGWSVAAGGDVDGDGCGELLIGARADGNFTGAAYVVSASDLPAADAADGTRDGVVEIRRVANQPNSWELTGEARSDNAGESVTFAGDVNGDRRADLLIGAYAYGDDDNRDDNRGAAYLLSGAALESADAADGDIDGRIALASVATQPDSWKLVGEISNRAGASLATANLDSDGKSDLVVAAAGERISGRADVRGGAVYLLAASDLSVIDNADGLSDSVIDLGNVTRGAASWKLIGDFEGHIGISGVTAGDFDGNGVDSVVVSNHEYKSGARYPDVRVVSVVSVADLPSADAADGTEDSIVTLNRTLAGTNSFRLVWEGASSRLSVSSGFKIDGDDLDDLLVGNEDAMGGGCHPEGGFINPGVVVVLSGGRLHMADAADGAADSVVDLSALPLGDGFWKFIGGTFDRLGITTGAGDLDGDGKSDPILGSYIGIVPYADCGSTTGPGSVFVMSNTDMAAADAVDGERNGEIHLDALGVPWQAASAPIVVARFDDRVSVVVAPHFLDYFIYPDTLIKAFQEQYGDVVDFLVVVLNLPANDPRYDWAGTYTDLRQSVSGIGKRVFGFNVYGQNLKGRITLSHFNLGHFPDLLRHEIMHAWAAFVVDAGRPHWGFSSANGVLGGFDPEQLVSLGGGRYTAGRFNLNGNDDRPYSPIELYLAGFVPPTEVPDLLVATDGKWLDEYDGSGNRIFTASDVETWSIERIVQRYGLRVPDWREAQRRFRAAALLIVDDASGAEGTARELSEALRRFSVAGPDGDDASWNFWETTGGRATLRTGPNRAPMAAGVLPDRTLAVDGLLVLDVRAAFADPDGDPLVYTGASSAPQVVAVTVSGAQMRLRGVTEGAATIEVTATDPDGLSAARRFAATVTTSPPFTDDPIVPGVTPVRAVHFTELRSRIDSLRLAAGLTPFAWTDPVLQAGETPVRLVHLLELRQALGAAYQAASRTPPRWIDAAPAAGATPIRAAHLTELRAAVVALE